MCHYINYVMSHSEYVCVQVHLGTPAQLCIFIFMSGACYPRRRRGTEAMQGLVGKLQDERNCLQIE